MHILWTTRPQHVVVARVSVPRYIVIEPHRGTGTRGRYLSGIFSHRGTYFGAPSGGQKEMGRVAITVVKRNGEREPYDANKINLAIEHASQGLDENITWVTQIASELELTLFDGITTQQLDEAVIQVALQNVKDDPAFDTVAARLLLKTIYKRVLGDYETDEELKELHRSHFAANV